MKKVHRLPTDPINDAFRGIHAEESRKSDKVVKSLDGAIDKLARKAVGKGWD